MRHLSLQSQTRKALDYADGSADRNGATVDLLNWQALRVTIHVHSVASGGTCTYALYESDDSGMSGETAVPQASKAIVDTDDGLIVQIDHVAPTKRYYRVKADKNGANNVAESAIYELYGPKLTNPTDIATELASVKTIAGTGQYTGP